MPLGTVVRTGMLIYLPGDGVKILATVLLAGPLRRALRRAETLYLCVLRAPSAAAARELQAHLDFHLYHGEIYCEMSPGVFYLLVFAAREEEVQVLLADAQDCVPGVRAQYKSVPKDE